jgi:hypothetical protein
MRFVIQNKNGPELKGERKDKRKRFPIFEKSPNT